MKPFLTLIILFMFSTLISCISYKEVVLTKVVSVKVKQMTAQKLVTDIELQINNPNPYTIRVADFNLDVFVNNVPSGKAAIKENIVLKKKSDDIHKITIETDMASTATGLFASLFSLLGNHSVKLRLKGEVKAKAYFIKRKIPLDVEETVSF